MRRRAFIAGLGSAAASPVLVRSQQATRVVGFLSPGLPEPSSFLVAAFRKGLSERGYVEGKNVNIEYRWAEGHYHQLQSLAADLLQKKVAVIAATGGTISALAAKEVTSTIPIVFNVGADPIGSGLVTSYNRPGGNATGVNTLSPALEAKRLDLLHELVPRTSVVAFLLNPSNPDSEVQRQEVQAATAAVGQHLIVFEASNKADLEKAFASLIERGADALIVGNDVFFTNLREYCHATSIAALGSRRVRVSTIFRSWRANELQHKFI